MVQSHLNGGAAAELRRLVARKQLRKSGAFFTGETLGRQMVDLIPKSDSSEVDAWDPNCGAGDLLIRWSERLDLVSNNLRSTLSDWSARLHGVELHPEFLRAAKRRLALAAVSRGAKLKKGKLTDLDDFFPGLKCRSLFEKTIKIPESAVVLMNPPFTMIQTPKTCAEWSSGKVAFAAVALINCLRAAKAGQTILAILPEVLRSGSRYQRWRELVSQCVSNAQVHVVGRFNEHADVDVFILHATKGAPLLREIEWFSSNGKTTSSTLGDFFEVRVGSVVPHRHKFKGPKVAYLTASTAPAWKEIREIELTLRHHGTCVKGPFLAIRRTSSPSDNSRAIATVVKSTSIIAVENHIITLRPKDGKLTTCRKLRNYLRSEQARRWIDGRIRCRHLTVSALKELPIDNLL